MIIFLTYLKTRHITLSPEKPKRANQHMSKKRNIFLLRLIHTINTNPLMPIIPQWLDWESH